MHCIKMFLCCCAASLTCCFFYTLNKIDPLTSQAFTQIRQAYRKYNNKNSHFANQSFVISSGLFSLPRSIDARWCIDWTTDWLIDQFTQWSIHHISSNSHPIIIIQKWNKSLSFFFFFFLISFTKAIRMISLTIVMAAFASYIFRCLVDKI
jgi:hypothetical protein